LGVIVRILRGHAARHIYVVIAVMLALLLRVALAEDAISLPTYVTFYPVVFLSAVLGGVSEGILAAALSALLADYFLMEPVGSFAIHSRSDIAGMVIFCASGVTVSIVTGLYLRHKERKAAGQIEATVPIARELQGGGESRLPTLEQARFRALLRGTIMYPFVAALVLAGAALWAAYNLNSSLQWVDHTDQVIAQSRRLLRLTADMETGERGFLVTGNDAFLQPYREASKDLESEYEKLYLMVADNPPQQTRLREIHNNLDHWQGYAERMIALRRAGGAYADLDANLAGKAEVDEIRDQIAGFQGVEAQLRDERNRVAHRDWHLIAILCVVLGLGVGCGVAIFTLRRMDVIANSFEKSRRALAESEQRWVTTLASIGDAVMAADKDGRITFLNPVAAALTGWQSEEAVGQPIQKVFNILNEQTRAPAEDIAYRVLTEGRTFELANHTALVSKDGREIPIADSAAPIIDSDGSIAGIVLVFHDVTERRRAEKILKTTLQRFYMVLSNLHTAVLLVTDEGRTEFANQAFCNLFGFDGSPAVQIGVDAAAMLERIKSSYHDPDQALQRIQEIVAGGVPVVSEEVPLRDGRTILRDYAPLTVDGKSYGRLWAHRDITELKRTEETLRESEAKLSAAMASMTDSVIITDAEGRFVDFNDAYAAFYRFKSKAECVRSFDEFASLFDVLLANGKTAPREMYAIQRALRGETATNAEYILRRKDTGESWIGSLSFSPIRSNDGAIIGSVVTAREITEAKRVEEERQIAVDFLAMVNQSGGTKDLLERATAFFQQRSGCEAVGIRLREGEDYPYFEARGFSDEFVQIESRLCAHDASGKTLKDNAGKAVLECLCGNVIRGCVEIAKPFYTAHGSFWSNSTTELMASASEGDLPDSTRNRCNREGYESVALFPIYTGEERYGLLQLVDRRKGRFSAQSIVMWERLAGHLATAVSKFQAEEAMREREQRLRLATDSAQLGIFEWMVPTDTAVWENKRMYEIFGIPESTDAVNRDRFVQETIHPEDLSRFSRELEESMRPGALFRGTYRIRRMSDGQWRWIQYFSKFELTPDGKPLRLLGVLGDITERKRSEEELNKLNRTLKALSNSNQAILHASDEERFLEEVCRVITSDCGHAMVWIGVAEHDEQKTVRPVAYSGFDEGYLKALKVRWDESEQGRGPTGTAIRTGQPSICRNMLTDPAFAPWREEAVKRGYASSLVIPLKDGNKAWGAITIYAREPDAFSEGEISLLMELAGDLEFGIMTLRLRAAHAQAEEALHESKEQLGLFVEHAPAALAMFDSEMRYMFASRRWMADYNLGDRDLRGVSHYDIFPEVPDEWKQAHRRGLAGEVLSSDADRFTRADGSEQWVRWEIRPWRNAEGKVGGIVIFSEEITERKKAEAALLRTEKLAIQRQQLQALAERIQRAREEERKMVARDLHDDIGQILTAIKMDMTWAVRHLPKTKDEVHERLAGSIELINDGVQSVRRICSGLRPGVLDDLGLAAAIEWQANEFSNRNGISCEVVVPVVELPIDGDRATAVFRIFQECLTNVARHAEAKSVRASLSQQDKNLLLVVEDDGKGFRESEVAGSLGVLGMKERAQVCGGSVQVSSSPGKGTKITVLIPLNAAGAERKDDEYPDR
jgi:PAS domain S-box-containing protein